MLKYTKLEQTQMGKKTDNPNKYKTKSEENEHQSRAQPMKLGYKHQT